MATSPSLIAPGPHISFKATLRSLPSTLATKSRSQAALRGRAQLVPAPAPQEGDHRDSGCEERQTYIESVQINWHVMSRPFGCTTGGLLTQHHSGFRGVFFCFKSVVLDFRSSRK